NYKDYPGQYTQVTVGFVAKKFALRKGYLAPVGRYIILGCYYQYAVDKFAQTKGVNNNNGSAVSSISHKKATVHFGGVTVGTGRNFVVAKRMILDLGFTLNIAPVPHLAFDDNSRIGVYRDVVLRNIFQIHLGIGALAF
ncbi:MAG TPA: hypothetical protein VK154_13020, partial [Chitinophagales bacterium]|nr:hypothetical protein [Chitinophagales bacterium]